MRLLRALLSRLRGTTKTTPRLSSGPVGELESIETLSSGLSTTMLLTEELRAWSRLTQTPMPGTSIFPLSTSTEPLRWKHEHSRSDGHDFRTQGGTSEESEVVQSGQSDQALGIEAPATRQEDQSGTETSEGIT